MSDKCRWQKFQIGVLVVNLLSYVKHQEHGRTEEPRSLSWVVSLTGGCTLLQAHGHLDFTMDEGLQPTSQRRSYGV